MPGTSVEVRAIERTIGPRPAGFLRRLVCRRRVRATVRATVRACPTGNAPFKTPSHRPFKPPSNQPFKPPSGNRPFKPQHNQRVTPPIELPFAGGRS